jgi:hypothetical protein
VVKKSAPAITARWAFKNVCHEVGRCGVHDQSVAANVLARQFAADGPNERWVGGANEILYSGAMETRSETGLAFVRRPLASMQHVSDRCERQSQHGAREVDVMPEAVRLAETHRWEQAKRFSDMCEDNDEQATGS